MVVCNPDFSNSTFDFSIRSGSLEIGTATIRQSPNSHNGRNTICSPNLTLSFSQCQNTMQCFLHINRPNPGTWGATFRADHRAFFSTSFLANSNLIAFDSLAIFLIVPIDSLTPAFVPANLMKRVGFSAHLREPVALVMLMVRIWLSSRSSMAATSTPDLTVFDTAFAAS